MNKLLIALVASLFASASMAQATATPDVVKAETKADKADAEEASSRPTPRPTRRMPGHAKAADKKAGRAQDAAKTKSKAPQVDKARPRRHEQAAAKVEKTENEVYAPAKKDASADKSAEKMSTLRQVL